MVTSAELLNSFNRATKKDKKKDDAAIQKTDTGVGAKTVTAKSLLESFNTATANKETKTTQKQSTKVEVKPIVQQVEQKNRSFLDKTTDFFKGAGKFIARTGVEAANLASSTLDFASDLLGNVITRQIKEPLIGIREITPPSQESIKRANDWKSFYDSTAGQQTEKVKQFTEKLRDIPFIQPSEEWQKASTQEKLTKRIGETVLNLGPGVVASLGTFAVSPPAGFAISAGSVADEIKTIAQKEGVNEETAESLGLATGLLVGFLDKIVPDELFSPVQKKQFLGSLAKRVIKTGLKEAGTEMAQEDIQLLVEGSLRDDLSLDEVAERNAMAGLGGLIGGSGASTLVSFTNGIKSGDIGGSEQKITGVEEQKKGIPGITELSLSPDATVSEISQKIATEKNVSTIKEIIKTQLFTDINDKVADGMAQRFVSMKDAGQIEAEIALFGKKQVTPKEEASKEAQTPLQKAEKIAKKELPAQELAQKEDEAFESLLESEQAKEIEEGDTVVTTQARQEIQETQQKVEERQAENETKKSILDMFPSNAIKAMRILKRSISARENKGMDPTSVMSLPSYKKHFPDIMSALNTESEDDVIRFIRDELPDAITSVETREDLQKIKVLQSVIKPKVKDVPRSQLPVPSAGKEKVSRLEARIKKTLDNASQDIIDRIGTATYKELNKKENIRKASEYVVNNPQEALRVLTGEVEAPQGILRNAIFVAMQNNARGNVGLARKLASLESTRMGQELSILTEIDPDSPVKILSDIYRIREQAAQKKYGKEIKEVQKKTKNVIENKVKKPTRYDWGEFISSIQC